MGFGHRTLASGIDEVELRIEGEPSGVVLVENRETFRSLLPLADVGYVILWVPGGPPPAEISLVRRLAELRPDIRFHACFDLDPAGIRIASLLAKGAEIEVIPTGMTPELFASAPRKLKLTVAGFKVEQETIQRELLSLFEGHLEGDLVAEVSSTG